MAIFQPSITVGGISGKVGGATFVNAKGSKVVRPSSIPRDTSLSNAGTLKGAVQGRFAQLARSWGQLTASQRQAWGTVAKQFPRVNRLGQKIPMSGYQLYMQQNGYRATTSLNFLSDPPSGPAWLPTGKPGFTFSGGAVDTVTATSQGTIDASWDPVCYLGFSFDPVNLVAPYYRFQTRNNAIGAPAEFTISVVPDGVNPAQRVGMRVFAKVLVLPTATRLASQWTYNSRLIS